MEEVLLYFRLNDISGQHSQTCADRHRTLDRFQIVEFRADQRLDLSAVSVAFPDTPVPTPNPPIEYIDVFNTANPATGLAELRLEGCQKAQQRGCAPRIPGVCGDRE